MSDSPQCEICFQPVGPFYLVRITPVTPEVSLSGAATSHHARIPGEKKHVCHWCRYAFMNLEAWTEPEAASEPEASPAVAFVPPSTPDESARRAVNRLSTCSMRSPPRHHDRQREMHLDYPVSFFVVAQPAYFSFV